MNLMFSINEAIAGVIKKKKSVNNYTISKMESHFNVV